jgi:hypothetical protein
MTAIKKYRNAESGAVHYSTGNGETLCGLSTKRRSTTPLYDCTTLKEEVTCAKCKAKVAKWTEGID